MINDDNVTTTISALEQELVSLTQEIGLTPADNRMLDVMVIMLEVIKYLKDSSHKHQG